MYKRVLVIKNGINSGIKYEDISVAWIKSKKMVFSKIKFKVHGIKF